jgi:hypothetical protein
MKLINMEIVKVMLDYVHRFEEATRLVSLEYNTLTGAIKIHHDKGYRIYPWDKSSEALEDTAEQFALLERLDRRWHDN